MTEPEKMISCRPGGNEPEIATADLNVSRAGISARRRGDPALRASMLIACDVDGTLIPPCSADMDAEIYPVIRRLKEKGIVFCAASGRQYASLRRLFAPVLGDMYFICENGAAVFGCGEDVRLIAQTVMDRAEALRLAHEIVAIPQCEYLISGARKCYITPKRDGYVALIRDRLHNVTEIVPSPEDIPEEIIKVSAYCPTDIGTVFPDIARRWAQFNPCLGGPQWIDLMQANKGTGLSQLCAALGVRLDDVVAFGDNLNDVPMLRAAGHPYIMEWAHADLRAQFPNCSGVKEFLARL